MKKTILPVVFGLLGMAEAFAQSSFATALPLQEGSNSTTALEIEGERGAYFKYEASELVVVSVTQKDNSSFSFYLDDTSSATYDYSSTSDANYVSTYSLKVAEGQILYIFAKQGYSAQGTEVGFDAKIFTGVLQHGMKENDPISLETGKPYWFEGGNAYFTYTATDDGVLVLTQPSYCYGASYTVDGSKKGLNWDSSTKEMSLPVIAGKEYSIWTSASSYGVFSVSARFTQPKQGEVIDNPFALVLGNNVLPAAAGKYYYKYLNDGDQGFLTVKAEGCTISARTVGSSYDNLSSNNQGEMKLQLDMDQEAVITVEKAADTAEAEVLTASFSLPEAGDLESNAIVLTSSETTQVSAPVGMKFYKITNNQAETAFLNVVIDSEGISSYGSSQFKVYENAGNYQYGGTALSSGEQFKVALEAGADYRICVKNVESEAILFRAWLSSIEDGDVYAKPITATLGENTVTAAGQKFYAYTAATTCKLVVTVGNAATTTLFFPSYDGDEYYGRDLISSDGGVYVLAAEKGETYIFRMTGASAGEKFTIAEEAYAAGQTKETALEMTGLYTFDDLNPYKVWLVYNVTKSGVAEITPAGFGSITYFDNIYYSVNDGSQSNIAGYDASYNMGMQEKTVAVNAGDKLYFQIDVQSYQEGATISVNVRDALPGEAPTNPLSINVNGVTTVPLVDYGGHLWYAFEVQSACEVTFSATEYASVSLFDSNLEQIHCGDYSASMTLGSYYEPYTLTLDPGTYYVDVTYTDGTELTVSGSDINTTGISAVKTLGRAMQEGVLYNLNGQRVSAAKGFVIGNAKMFVK